MASIYQTAIDQELNHLATQASSFLDRLYPAGKLAQVCVFYMFPRWEEALPREQRPKKQLISNSWLYCYSMTPIKVLRLQSVTTVNVR